MDSSDEEVLLESCFFSQTIIRSKSKKKKEKDECAGNIYKKQENRKRIAFQVICKMNFLAKVMKKNVRLGPLLFIKILLKTA